MDVKFVNRFKIISLSLLCIIFCSGIVILTSNTDPTDAFIYDIPLLTVNNSLKVINDEITINSLILIEPQEIPEIKFSITPLNGDSNEFRIFTVKNFETDEYYEINATLQLNSTHNLIYTDLPSVNMTELEQLNYTFETSIYPQMINFFGHPEDIDNNDKIILLVFDIQDGLSDGSYIAGYFYILNQFLNEDLNPSQRYSNEAEILHIDPLALDGGGRDILSHEFQHLIHYSNDQDEEVWLDEGASMFSQYIVSNDTYNGGTHKIYFQLNPDVSLTYWDSSNAEDLLLANYGAVYTFYRYIAEKYGGSTTIQNIVADTDNGITSIEDILTNTGYEVTFPEVFRNWTIANYVNNISIDDNYGYMNLSLFFVPEFSYSSSSVLKTENSVPYWGTDYLSFESSINLPFVFEFQGDDSSEFLVTVILTNTTSSPQNKIIIPLDISELGLSTFSSEIFGVSSDSVEVVISSYPELGEATYSDSDPAPSQTYWYTVNPQELIINPGNFTLFDYSQKIKLWNITVSDLSDLYWQEADGASYEIFANNGSSTGISGILSFNSSLNYWESEQIEISTLTEGNYRILFHFVNDTSSGFSQSELFEIFTISIYSDDYEVVNNSILNLWNVQIYDNHGTIFNESEESTYEIFDTNGVSTGIRGDLSFNPIFNYWKALSIDISMLTEGEYVVQLDFICNYGIAQNVSIHFSIGETSDATSSIDYDNQSSEQFSIESTFSTVSTSANVSTSTPPNEPIQITSFPLLIILITLSSIVIRRRNK